MVKPVRRPISDGSVAKREKRGTARTIRLVKRTISVGSVPEREL
jgi:hypothetical protein